MYRIFLNLCAEPQAKVSKLQCDAAGQPYQSTLMENLLDYHYNISVGNLSMDLFPAGECRWHGVTCSPDLEVVAICWQDLYAEAHVSVDWLPSELASLKLIAVNASGKIHTRCFPKRLVSCHMERCSLFGPINLRTLPGSLEFLFLEENNLDGTIDLTRLPHSIMFVNLSENNFRKVVYSLALLPDSLDKVTIHYKHELGRRRMRVEVLGESPEKNDTRIDILAYMEGL